MSAKGRGDCCLLERLADSRAGQEEGGEGELHLAFFFCENNSSIKLKLSQ